MDKSISNNKKTMEFYDSLLNYFEDLNTLQAKVGVHSTSGQNNVNKAKWNEYGKIVKLKRSVKKKLANGKTIKLRKGKILQTPPRPFIRLYLYPDLVDNLIDEVKKNFEKVFLQKKIKKNDAKKTYKVIGDKALELMRYKMLYRGFSNEGNFTGKDPEHNAPLTIAIKGHDDPLIDTGRLYDVMQNKVSERGS